jgi:ribonuclease BN (tRNA processing enzyme)
VWDDDGHCAVVDPGYIDAERNEIVALIERKNLKPVCILLTHAHFDHIYGVADFARTYNVPVYMSAKEAYTIEHTNPYVCGMYGLDLPDLPYCGNGGMIRHGEERSDILRHGEERSDILRHGEEQSDILRHGEEQSDVAISKKAKKNTVKPHNVREGRVESDGSIQLSFFQLEDPLLSSLKEDLEKADLNNMTPLQAFDLLRNMKEQLGI